MPKFYDNEYSFVKMERLRIYSTNEFKDCTLTCTLVRGGNKQLFPQNAKWGNLGGRGGRDSFHCGFYQDTNLLP